MIQFIGDDGVLGTQQGFKQAAIGIEAGGVEDRVIGAQEFTELLFQLAVYPLGSADEPDTGATVAPLVERVMRGLANVRMLGESKIVVRTHVQHG